MDLTVVKPPGVCDECLETKLLRFFEAETLVVVHCHHTSTGARLIDDQWLILCPVSEEQWRENLKLATMDMWARTVDEFQTSDDPEVKDAASRRLQILQKFVGHRPPDDEH